MRGSAARPARAWTAARSVDRGAVVTFQAMSATSTCPGCGAPASGKFCSSCGTPLEGAVCAGCRATLTPGARFCHRCGLPVGAPAPAVNAGPAEAATAAGDPKGFGGALPWAVAAIALVALIALVAGQRFARRGAESGANADASLPSASMVGPRATTDIANMSPEERAERLYNRVMSYNERGATDSAQIFAPMAIQAYEMIGTLNADQRYDLGRIALVAGDAATAAAQADTILAGAPSHLLGLILATEAAEAQKQTAKAAAFRKRFVAAAPAERAKGLPEYVQHTNDIDAALADAKQR